MELSLTSIAAIATALGGGSIITLWLTRRFRKADQKEEMHVTVESKKIDADSDAFTHVINRLEKVEQWLKELQDKLATEMATNSRLEAENEALRKDNDRQQGEIERLRAEIAELKAAQALEPAKTPEAIEALFPELTDAQIKDEIEKLTGSKPRGNPSRETLVKSLQELREAA